MLDSFKLKEFAVDKSKFDGNGGKFSKRVENTAREGEIACYERFLISHSVLKRLALQTCKNQGLFGKGVNQSLWLDRKHEFNSEKNIKTYTIFPMMIMKKYLYCPKVDWFIFSRERIDKMEHQLANLAAWVQSAVVQSASSTGAPSGVKSVSTTASVTSDTSPQLDSASCSKCELESEPSKMYKINALVVIGVLIRLYAREY